MNAQPTFGVCGLGNAGASIAGRLAQAGSVIAYDVDRSRLRGVASREGLSASSDLCGLVDAPSIVLSLPNPGASRDVLEALSPQLTDRHVVIETSTVNADDIQREHRILRTSRAQLIDAAIIGGVDATAGGSATLLIGGDPAALRVAAPTLDAISHQQIKLGGLGSGMAAKVINNAVAHAIFVVLVEAFSLGAATGVDPDRLVELLQRPDAGLVRPLTHRIAERAFSGNYNGGMTVQAARKDSNLAITLGQSTGVPLFAIQAAHTAYEIAMGVGLARSDYASIATLWENWTGNPIGRRA